MFGIERNYIIAVVAIIACMYPLWEIFLNKRGAKAQDLDVLRHARIDDKIQSLNGKVIEIEQIRRNECPVIDVIEIGSQVYYICYRVSYSVETKIEETWALINVKAPKQPVIWPELDDL